MGPNSRRILWVCVNIRPFFFFEEIDKKGSRPCGMYVLFSLGKFNSQKRVDPGVVCMLEVRVIGLTVATTIYPQPRTKDPAVNTTRKLPIGKLLGRCVKPVLPAHTKERPDARATQYDEKLGRYDTHS